MNARDSKPKKYAYLIEVADDRAESAIEAENRFKSLTTMSLPTNGYQVIRTEKMKAPPSDEKTRQQLLAECDLLTDPRWNQ